MYTNNIWSATDWEPSLEKIFKASKQIELEARCFTFDTLQLLACHLNLIHWLAFSNVAAQCAG